MDQIREESDSRELRELMMEILKVQERILHRMERLEEALGQLQEKEKK